MAKVFGKVKRKVADGWYRYKKRASPRRIKSRPFIHCLLTPKKLNSRMSSASRSATYSIDGKLSK